MLEKFTQLKRSLKMPRQEDWKLIKDFEDAYEVSNMGRVKSFRGKEPRILKGTLNSNGYFVVGLTRRGMGRGYLVHRLVLEAFVGPCPSGCWGCHSDSVRVNNRIDNLRWDTPKNNSADRKKTGISPVGETNPKARLKASDILEIRASRRTGTTLAALGRIYGVGASCISEICNGRNWRHV